MSFYIKMKIFLLLVVFTTVLLSCTSSVTTDIQTTSTNNHTIITTVDTLCWTDFIIGEPPMIGEFDGIDSLTKKYNICYTRILNGCEMNSETDSLRKNYQLKNEQYFKQLELKLGVDWKSRFDAELLLLNKVIAKKYTTAQH